MNVPPEHIAALLKLAEVPLRAKHITSWGMSCDFSVAYMWIGGIIVELPSENSDRVKYQYIGGRVIRGVPEVLVTDVEFPPKGRESVGLDTLKAHAPSLMLWV